MIQKTYKLVFIFLLMSAFLNAQLHTYNQKREIKNITEQWHRIELPVAIFPEIKNNLADIRMYGITANDTIEAPYILKVKNSISRKQPVDFKLLNKTKNSKGYYYTYDLQNSKIINEIFLDFEASNFDYSLTLEGSQDQIEWYTLADSYRIIAIQNELANYKFTTLKFPSASYRYFRIIINSKDDPNLKGAQIAINHETPPIYDTYPIKKINTFFDENSKKTTLDIDLEQAGFISTVKIMSKDNFDYYRPITISYALDSVPTEKGYKIAYRNAYKGILSSLEENEFSFKSNKSKKIKIIIDHKDNEPIEIESVVVKGYQHELIARFDKTATYYLAYGNKAAMNPVYDIQLIPNIVPQNIAPITLGKSIPISKNVETEKKPLFENKNWLWVIMVILIIIVGWFTWTMIRQSSS